MLKPFQSIEEYGGLELYLNDTAEDHNGFGYDQFIAMIDQDNPPNKTNIGKIFGVDARTIEKWKQVKESENNNG